MDVIAYVQSIKTNINFYESVQENCLAVSAVHVVHESPS